jgi:uncharacterized membrane protein
MVKISKTIQIHAPLKKVYAFMTDPNNLPVIWPSMVEVSHVKVSPDGAHSFDWVYKMVGFKIEGSGETIEVIPHKKVVVENKRGIHSIHTYHYREENNETILEMQIEYDIPLPLLGKMAEAVVAKMNDHEAEILLNNLKINMEG